MSRILRRSPWLKGIVLFALVSLVSGAWLTVVHGSLVEGGACPAEFDASAAHHGLTIGHEHGAVAHHDCYICRWLRSLRSMTGDAPPVPAGIGPTGIVHPDPIDHEGHVALVSLPARSPPA
jgi:hypothetical protein